jgi:hypothetical protein
VQVELLKNTFYLLLHLTFTAYSVTNEAKAVLRQISAIYMIVLLALIDSSLTFKFRNYKRAT